MMYKITEQQRDELIVVKLTDGWHYNPVQDIHGDWFISIEEISMSSIEWMKDLELTEFTPIGNEVN